MSLFRDPSQGKFEFDIPYKELSFSGVPAKQQVTIMPTVHSLVALDDNPPMVVTLAEVEVANFERIQFGLKNFDLVFVWKDFKKLPMRIEAIPVKHLERIKTWLNSCDIVFYESAQNILWKTVMKVRHTSAGGRAAIELRLHRLRAMLELTFVFVCLSARQQINDDIEGFW